jgi:hypothetical protein
MDARLPDAFLNNVVSFLPSSASEASATLPDQTQNSARCQPLSTHLPMSKFPTAKQLLTPLLRLASFPDPVWRLPADPVPIRLG